MIYQETKAGIPICPFFVWESENIGDEDKSAKEYDVNLVHCTHPKNEVNCEGNCQEDICPLLKE